MVVLFAQAPLPRVGHVLDLVAQVVLASLRSLSGTPFAVLANEDMVLHSALHLLMSDELRGGIRDLFDIRMSPLMLVRHLA